MINSEVLQHLEGEKNSEIDCHERMIFIDVTS